MSTDELSQTTAETKAVFIPGIYAGAKVNPVALDQAIGATSWFS
jgi:hypothetical protein